MLWGINKDAPEKDRVESDMADYLNGLNSTGEISDEVYDKIFDMSMELLDKMYKLGHEDGYFEGKKDANNGV